MENLTFDLDKWDKSATYISKKWQKQYGNRIWDIEEIQFFREVYNLMILMK